MRPPPLSEHPPPHLEAGRVHLLLPEAHRQRENREGFPQSPGAGKAGRRRAQAPRHPWEPCRSPGVCPLERRDMGVLDWGRPGLRAENWELGEFCALRLRPPHPHGCLQKGREPPSDSRGRGGGGQQRRRSRCRVLGSRPPRSGWPEDPRGNLQGKGTLRQCSTRRWDSRGRDRPWDRNDTRRKRGNKARGRRAAAGP